MGSTAVSLSTILADVTLEIRVIGVRSAAWRLWIAVQVMKLAARIAGTAAEISLGKAADFDERTHDRSHFEWGPQVDVFLDGVRQDRVISFDVDMGLVRTYVGDGIETEVRRGVVELMPSSA